MNYIYISDWTLSIPSSERLQKIRKSIEHMETSTATQPAGGLVIIPESSRSEDWRNKLFKIKGRLT